MWKCLRHKRCVDEAAEQLNRYRTEWMALRAEADLGALGSTSSRLRHIDSRLRHFDTQFRRFDDLLREIHARLDRIEGIR